MKFHVICQKAAPNAYSPIQVVEQTTGRGVGWVIRYLDREYVRRLTNTTLRIYAYNLLHFVRWWESLHHTGDIVEADLTESTLLDYLRFQSSLQPRPSASTCLGMDDYWPVQERVAGVAALGVQVLEILVGFDAHAIRQLSLKHFDNALFTLGAAVGFLERLPDDFVPRHDRSPVTPPQNQQHLRSLTAAKV
jgi:hypothetical protein